MVLGFIVEALPVPHSNIFLFLSEGLESSLDSIDCDGDRLRVGAELVGLEEEEGVVLEGLD